MKRRLFARIALAMCLGTAVILGLAFAWNLELQRSHLERLVGLSADRVAEYIRGATRDAMLRNDAESVHRIIENIGGQPGIERIRIFNKEGRIRTSTRPEERGLLVDVRAEQCIACHKEGRPLERALREDRIRTFRGTDGRRVLGVIAPIHNEPQCTTMCHAHPASQRVLGVLDVQLSMETVDESLRASERQLSLGLVATVSAVLVLAGVLIWRMVLRPVHQLTGAMTKVTQGDLAIRVPVRSQDEIGAMAVSWNTMTEELGRARAELQDWNRTLEERVASKARALEQAHQHMVVVEKMASLGKLAAVVAHEINNPLAGIRTYARVLRRAFKNPEAAAVVAAPGSPVGQEGETDRILGVVEDEAARCGEIVRNLLVFSRASPAHFVETDLRPLLERCRILLRHKAELLGVQLDVVAAGDLHPIVCDASQVEQMLLALTVNGLEATPSGGSVRLAAAGDGEDVIVTVTDTGGGIPPEDQARIFEPFYTTKGEGKGVGLGLAVVYGIVTRHRGQIDVVSRPGQTVFTVRLPPIPPSDPSPGEAS